jgi:hypothetical protein
MMQDPINTRETAAVEAEVRKAYAEMFPRGDNGYVARSLGWAVSWFSGNYSGYLPVDTRYHDLEHTFQGTVCMARLLRCRASHGRQPALSQRTVELGLLGMLMHDSGYLKRLGDDSGTGAKYTLVHVERSIEFAGEFMRAQNFSASEINAVQNMIRCTGVNVKLESIQFESQEHRVAGYALGTADLLGQMAAPDYVDKLPVLYQEFAEAARFTGNPRMRAGGFFNSAEELMQKTPLFWENYVKTKINDEFGALYRELNDPYPDGPNPYIDGIEANMARLRKEQPAGLRF